jgi:hypothetical protein
MPPARKIRKTQQKSVPAQAALSQPDILPTDPTTASTPKTHAEDDTIGSVSERVVPNIIKRCSISDSDLFNELSPNEIETLAQRVMPELCDNSKRCMTVQRYILTFYLQTYKHSLPKPRNTRTVHRPSPSPARSVGRLPGQRRIQRWIRFGTRR